MGTLTKNAVRAVDVVDERQEAAPATGAGGVVRGADTAAHTAPVWGHFGNLLLAPLTQSDMTPRILSSIVCLFVLVGFCIWGTTPFVLFTVALALMARTELTRAYQGTDIRPNALLSLVGALLPAAVLLLPLPFRWGQDIPVLPVLLVLAGVLIAAGVWETARAERTPRMHAGSNIAYGLLCGAYLSLFGGIALLRICSWPGPHPSLFPLEDGAALALLTMTCTMAGDTGAFLVGRWIGRHKFAKRISPHKTTEGLAGGILASIVVGGATSHLMLGSIGFGLMVGAAAAVLGPLGDLFASAMKREIGIKDFGKLIPGHGGILDRFDSLLFTAPVVVLLSKAFVR